MRFKYRLQPLFDQRQRDLEHAEEELLQRKKELRDAERRKQQLIDEERSLSIKLIESRRNILVPPPNQPLTFDELDRRKLFQKAMAEELESLRDAVFSQELAVDEVRGVVREAEMKTSERKRAVEILEKHRAKLEKRFLTEIEQKEALEQDELGNVMYLMQRAK